MATLVCGVGINDRSIPIRVNGKVRKEYVLWTTMLNRVYSSQYIEKYPSYIGCSISTLFLHYTSFHNWCQTQIGFNIEGFSLDKDLLIKGNKQYSEDTCVFIPLKLNNLITRSASTRGSLPIGVNNVGSKFRAQCSIDSKLKHIGMYGTVELAFQAYKSFKEAYIKQQAELYKDVIDPRAYQALLNYEVSIDD